MTAIATNLIPGLADYITTSLFAVGTGLFVLAMGFFYKQLKAKKAKEKLT